MKLVTVPSEVTASQQQPGVPSESCRLYLWVLIKTHSPPSWGSRL